MATVNPMDMSDEELLNMSAPPIVEEPAPVETPAAAPAASTEPTPVAEAPAEPAPAAAPVVETPAEPAPVEEVLDDKALLEKGPPVIELKQEDKPAPVEVDAEGKPIAPAAAVPEAGSKEGDKPAEPAQTPIDFAAVGEMIMKPFKADGQTIQLRTPEEALKLMQMGAHFTRKMQAIQPHKKVLTMLESNGLLDPDKLSFLIDIDKKNPAAIQKLIKDAGLDPLEIDTSAEPNYQAGAHIVTDEEVKFQTALDDLQSAEGGQESLQLFNDTWDPASKNIVWKDPSLLAVMHEQRSNGIYDRITSEMARQRTLGQISPDMSFLEAYQRVGTVLQSAGGFNDLLQPASPATSQGQAPAPVVPAAGVPAAQNPAPAANLQPVATRIAAPKTEADNNDKAKAAAPTVATPTPAKAAVNILAMADDEFLANFKPARM